jgi:hypothetical protein
MFADMAGGVPLVSTRAHLGKAVLSSYKKNPAKTETLLHQKTLKYQILKLATVDIKADATVETKVQGSTKC